MDIAALLKQIRQGKLGKLKELLGDAFEGIEETKIDDLLAQLVDESTAGLKKNNSSLITEKRNATERLQSLDEILEGLSDEELREAIRKHKTAKASGDKGGSGDPNVATLQRDLEAAHAKKTSKLEQQITNLKAFIKNTLIGAELAEALAETEVAEKARGAVKRMLADKCEIVEDGDGYKAVARTDMGEMEIKRFVREWSTTDEGAFFVKAPDNAGAGASGSKNKSGEKDEPNPFLPGEHNNLTKQAEILRKDPEKAERLAAAAGVKI